jgi:Glycosyltransferase like family
MIAFGCAVTDHALYERFAERGIKLVAEPDSKVVPLGSAGLGDASIFRNYNLLLEEAAKMEDLEALVIVHQDAEIVDERFCAKVRSGLQDPEVGILGCAGAIGVRNIAWWDGSVTIASFSHRYEEYGGGEILGSTFNWEEKPPEAREGEVDVIDGFMMALPPWFVENIRFDESLGQFHGYDFDVCQQVRAAGKKVMTEHIRVIHHHSLALIGDVDGWIAAHMRIAEKWDGKLSPAQTIPGDWTERARWAEARRDAALMQANAAELARDAAVSDMVRQLANVQRSASWRLTRPLRWLKSRFSRRADEPSRDGNSPGPLPSRQR